MTTSTAPTSLAQAPSDPAELERLLAATGCRSAQELEAMAAPWPVEWLVQPRLGDPARVVELFAGSGGWSTGVGAVLGVAVDAVGVDISPDACATATAAGHRRICADVTRLDPEHPALRYVEGVILSPPCPPWSPAGKQAGRVAANLEILEQAINEVGEAAGFIHWDQVDCDQVNLDGNCQICDAGEYHEGYLPRCGCTWPQVRTMLADLTDPRIGLMLEVVIWPLAMQAANGWIQWIAMEQSSRLPEEVLDNLSVEFRCADWFHTDRTILEAAHYGVASRRERCFFIATRHDWAMLPAAADDTRMPPPEEQAGQIPPTTMAQALGWGPGERVNTRGVRPVDPATGRARGGNLYSADQPSWCLTGRTRSWYRESDGRRLSEAEAGLLVGFRGTYPWAGSRTSAFQQIGDVVSPVVAAVVMGAVLREEWQAMVPEYVRELYTAALQADPAPRIARQRNDAQPALFELDQKPPEEVAVR